MRKMLASATAKLTLLLLLPFYGITQISIPNSTPVVQNFDAIGSSATANLPANWKMSDAGATNPTWLNAGNFTATNQEAHAGSPTIGGRYNWATTASTDRSIGFITSGGYANPNSVMAFYRNTSGSLITSLNVSFNIERYRDNSTAATVSFFISFDGVNWLSIPSGNVSFAIGTNTYSFAPLSTVARTVSLNNLSIANNADVFFRWSFNTGSSNSQGLGLDDVSVTANPNSGSPTLTANLGDHLTDANANGQANVGETIQYRDTVKNAGPGEANNLTLTNTAPANTTFNSGTVKTSALARDDNYTTSVNFAITSAANLNVLTNDYGLPSISVLSYGTTASGGITTLAGAIGATNAGGSITINAAGLITNYTPPSNFSGIDQFKYIARAGTGLPDNDAVVSITVPDINFITTTVDPSCNNSTNGSITINATGGVGTLTYSKNGSGGSYQASNIFTGLAGGTYNLAVKDANGYFKTGTATLTNPGAITVTGNNVPTLTYTVAMTPITFSKTGGTGTPSNPWSATGLPTGLSINSATGDLSGTPTVTGMFNPVVITYTDANGCTGSVSKTINVAPKLTGDAYNVVGNTQLVADNHSTPTTPFTSSTTNILTNDQSNAAITTTAGTFATANGGSITIGNDGKFTYTPPAGFTGPTDSYAYTATSNGVNAIATITFNIASMVWYVNNTYNSGANGPSDGRSNHPFIDVASAEAASAINQIIYVHTGSGNTPGNAVLKSAQFLFGAGRAFTVNALSIPAGTKPTLSGMITLANNVLVDGFDMNTGSATPLTSTGATGVAVTIGNINSSGAAYGANLVNTTGTITIAGGTQTNAATSAFYISGGTVSLTYSGSITHNSSSPMVEVGGSHNTGTVTFNTGTLTATGTGTALFLSDANGTYNFNGTAAISSAAGIYIANTVSTAGGTFSFGAGTSITNPTGTAFKVFNGRATVTYSGNITKNNAGTMVEISGGHNTGTVTFQTGTLSATTASAGNGLQFNDADGTYNFNGTTTLNGGDAGIDISNGSGGSFTFLNAPITNPSGHAINIASSGCTVAHTGAIAHNALNFRAVNIASNTNANVTINSAISITGSSQGIGVVSNSGTSATFNGNLSSSIAQTAINVTSNTTSGTVAFNGTSKSFSTSTATAVSLVTNTGVTINFSNGGLVLTTTGTATGFNATGGGTINITGTGNTISTPAGTALNVNATTIGASGLTFQSITSNSSGANAGIVLDNTGSTGGLTVTGTGTTAGSGGTIANKTGADILSGTNPGGQTASGSGGTGIFLRSTSNPSFSYMQLNDFTNFAIYGNNITGFNLANSTINGTNGNNNAGNREESSIRFDNLRTSASFPNATIASNTISGGADGNILVHLTSGTLNRLSMTNNTFGLIGTGGALNLAGDNVDFTVYSNAVGNITCNDNQFLGTRGDFIEFSTNDNSTMDIVCRQNKFSDGQAIIPGGGVAVSVRADGGGSIIPGSINGSQTTAHCTVTFDVSCNRLNGNNVNAHDVVGMFFAKGNGSGTMDGTINNNIVGPAKTNANADGIFLRCGGGGSSTVLIRNNTLTGWGNAGIHLQNNDGNCTINASLFGNNVTAPGTVFPYAPLFIDNGGTGADANIMNIVIGSFSIASNQNTFAGNAGAVVDVELSNFNATTKLNLSKNGSSAVTAAGVVQDDNVGTPSFDNTGGSGTTTLVATLPATPAAVTLSCTIPARISQPTKGK